MTRQNVLDIFTLRPINHDDQLVRGLGRCKEMLARQFSRASAAPNTGMTMSTLRSPDTLSEDREFSIGATISPETNRMFGNGRLIITVARAGPDVYPQKMNRVERGRVSLAMNRLIVDRSAQPSMS